MSWPLVKLGVVAPSRPLKTTPVQNNQKVWLLNLDMVESQSGRIINKVTGTVEESGSSTHWFSDKHVLYSKLRPYLNKVVLPDAYGLATTELVPMLPDEARLDRSYLAHYLRSKKFVNWVSEQVAGAKMPRVSMKVFWDHEIPLPPLAEQKRIAAILDKADAIRQKRKQAIDLVDEFLRSVFLDMFGDPVTNPKGWEKVELRRLLGSIDSGKSPKCESRPAIADEWGVLKVSAVTSGEYASQENKAYLDSPDLISKYEVKAGDVLFTRKNTHKLVAAVSYVFESEAKRTMPDLIFRLNVNDEAVINKLYLWGLLSCSSQRSEIQALAGGAAGSMPNISKANLLGVRVPVPSIELQKKYSEIVFKHRTSVSKLAEALKYEEVLFNSLSQKAFSGEL